MLNVEVGPCPEIYQEKVFKNQNFIQKRLLKAKLLGETSIVFPINPYKSLKKINLEISSIKKILNQYL